MPPTSTRRQMLSQSIAAAGGAGLLAQTAPAEAAPRAASQPFRYCLNTSTIRGQKLPLVQEIEIAARAGYQGIEPWAGEIDEYTRSGGTLPDLKKRFADVGLTVAGVIGFAEWIVDDEAQRRERLGRGSPADGHDRGDRRHRHRRSPGRRLGKGSARPGQDGRPLSQRSWSWASKHGVVAAARAVGFCTRVEQVERSGLRGGRSRAVRRACILADAYHLYKGGSDYTSLRLLAGQPMRVFHINDYPATPERTQITDACAFSPATGSRRSTCCFARCARIDFGGMLSLELFNRDYWNQIALFVARTGWKRPAPRSAKPGLTRGSLADSRCATKPATSATPAAKRSSSRSILRPGRTSNTSKIARSAAIRTCCRSKLDEDGEVRVRSEHE